MTTPRFTNELKEAAERRLTAALGAMPDIERDWDSDDPMPSALEVALDDLVDDPQEFDDTTSMVLIAAHMGRVAARLALT